MALMMRGFVAPDPAMALETCVISRGLTRLPYAIALTSPGFASVIPATYNPVAIALIVFASAHGRAALAIRSNIC